MLTGRKEEQIKLLNAMESDESEFIAVYGRRRVGKTFLIRETFGYKFTFSHTGLAKKCTREQLANFQSSLKTGTQEGCAAAGLVSGIRSAYGSY